MDQAVQQKPLTFKDYKSDYKPVWCPGCGDFSVLASITKALAELQIPREDAAVISGIGCSSRIPAYTSVYGFHGIHGRALASATGLKVARPDLTVVATGGDGDGFSIGGNHFLHACRRNVDMTYIVMDNEVYGMTKGQASPTTASDWDGSKLTPHGTGVSPFNPLSVALSAGAGFVARGFAGDPNGSAKLIAQAMQHKGFSFVQILSPCVTFRPEQAEWKKIVRKGEIDGTNALAEAMTFLATDDGFSTGVLYETQRPVYAPDMEEKMSVSDIEESFEL
ncbi:2-oxoglutarate ferredoxin oxidoreductase, beta subunit [Candidatus Terasakiella magnetica]|uniref:2-oxoglutarate ferredoxin oxidoreductase, beta subunit n=1 Tax=Candidatus Terasakiella magnetica TaxID=1867952 RepID=A0A1C3REB1_9PROT|nr:2-oxoacid:ferredoxin oxidoreductase subunit beta [Candidatus Terasakiella magnetica]SCA55623.1 2-oxoglutarate ferredoxin oxidoreductase, beta subunit [Candidatus Terasakiella magnetica]